MTTPPPTPDDARVAVWAAEDDVLAARTALGAARTARVDALAALGAAQAGVDARAAALAEARTALAEARTPTVDHSQHGHSTTANTVTPEPGHVDPMPFSRLHETGVLWAINRWVFHPRGLALAVLYPDGTDRTEIQQGEHEPVDWSILGDGSEVWAFPPDDDDDGFARFTAFMAEVVSEPAASG